VELLQPVVRGRLQKAAHLSAGVHEITAAPFADAHIRMGIFIQSCAVIIGQCVCIQCKMHGYEIQKHAYARGVAFVDELLELVGRAVAARGCEKAGVLVPPGAVRRVLAQGHEFNIVIAVFFYVGNQLVRDFIIAVPSVFAGLVFFPGAEMHLINIDGRIESAAARRHPGFVCETVPAQRPERGGAARTKFHPKAIGVAMVRLTARSGTDFVFIQHAGLCALYTAGKYAALSLPGHGHTLPAVEFSNQLHSLCAGRIGAEGYAVSLKMRAEKTVRVECTAGVKIVQVHFWRPPHDAFLFFHYRR